MAVAACNVNFVNACMIAYRVHVYTRASLIHSPNPNLDSSNRISPKLNSDVLWQIARFSTLYRVLKSRDAKGDFGHLQSLDWQGMTSCWCSIVA